MAEWVELLEGGKLPPDFVLTEDLLKEMGVSAADTSAVLATLKSHRVKTWGFLVAIKTEAELATYAGDKVTGVGLWAYLEGYRNKQRQELHPIPHFESNTIQRANLPLKYVQHTVYTQVFNMLDNLLARLPNPEARNHVVPCLVGAMGVGKTRTALEACNAVAQKHERTVVLCFRLRLRVFQIAAFDDDLDVLANALVLANRATFKRAVSFEEVSKALHRDGFSKVLLYIDQVQLKHDLVKRLVTACFKTMTVDYFGVCVVPVLTGIVLPVGDPLPSGGRVEQIQLTLLEPRAFLETFAERIGVDPDSVEQNPHLNELLHLCSGSPHAVDLMTREIRKEAEERPQLRQGLGMNLLHNDAREIYRKALESLRYTYGEFRLHAVINHQMSDAERRNRESWHMITKNVIEWLFCECFLGVEISDQDRRVGTTDQNDERFPTYAGFIEAGIVSINAKTKALDMPLMGLMVLDEIVKVLPTEMNDPFSANWRSFEVIGAVSLYLRLKYAMMRKEKDIPITTLRPGALSTCPSDLHFVVPERLRFAALGGKITGNLGDAIDEGAYGKGSPISLSLPGVVAMVKEGETAIDAFCYLDGKRGEDDIKLLVLNRAKVREKNVGKGIAADSVLYNGTILTIIPAMQEIGTKIKTQFGLPDNIVYVSDVFIDKHDPDDPDRRMEEILVPMFITRDEELDKVVGPNFAHLPRSKRQRRSTMKGQR